jgi:hypothetical protein
MHVKDKKGDFLNKSLALVVLGAGMMIIAFRVLGAPGTFQLGILGGLVGLWGATRLGIYNRIDTTWDE